MAMYETDIMIFNNEFILQGDHPRRKFLSTMTGNNESTTGVLEFWDHLQFWAEHSGLFCKRGNGGANGTHHCLRQQSVRTDAFDGGGCQPQKHGGWWLGLSAGIVAASLGEREGG